MAWHEIAHAWKTELDIVGDERLAEESLCNMIGLAMVNMPPRLICRPHIYMAHGIDARDVVMPTGCNEIIPVVAMGG